MDSRGKDFTISKENLYYMFITINIKRILIAVLFLGNSDKNTKDIFVENGFTFLRISFNEFLLYNLSANVGIKLLLV